MKTDDIARALRNQTTHAAADAIRAQVKAILSRRTETLDTIAEHKQALA